MYSSKYIGKLASKNYMPNGGIIIAVVVFLMYYPSVVIKIENIV